MAAYSGFTHKQTAPAVHLLGIVGIVLVLIWTSYYRGGYGLTGAAVFNVSCPSLHYSPGVTVLGGETKCILFLFSGGISKGGRFHTF